MSLLNSKSEPIKVKIHLKPIVLESGKETDIDPNIVEKIELID